MENLKLVSVCVITYNSSKYVIETLESIKAQNYQKLELVISDDCSTDDTILICEKWIAKNKVRFVKTQILTASQNTGVPANVNRAISAIAGEWCKIIAGDDMLLLDCVTTNMSYVLNNVGVEVVFSKCRRFWKTKQKQEFGGYLPRKKAIELLKSEQFMQLQGLYEKNYIPAASSFFRTSLLKEYPFDERYRSFEDYPYWMKLAKMGICFNYIDTLTVLYRQCESISQSNINFLNKTLYLDRKEFYYREIFEDLRKQDNDKLLLYSLKQKFLDDVCVLLLNNRRTFLNKLILSLIKKWLNL